jgi:hypothetical protein
MYLNNQNSQDDQGRGSSALEEAARKKLYGLDPRYLLDASLGLSMDIVMKGGANHLGDGLLFPLVPKIGKFSHPSRAIYGTYNMAKPQLLNLVADVGISSYKAFKAPKGQKISSGIASLVAGTLSFIPGSLAGGPIGGALTEAVLSAPLERKIKAGINSFIDAGRDRNRLHMGGGYVDSEPAYTMRQRAAQEIGRGLMNARQHLGNEAMLYHQ